MSRWAMLPAYLVRLAGFSFDRLDVLRAPESAAAAVTLEAATAARLAAGAAFDVAVSQARYAENPALDDAVARKALSRHVKHARAFARVAVDTPLPVEALAEVVGAIEHVAPLAGALVEAHQRWLAAKQMFDTTFAADLERVRLAIRTMYGADERLRESVFLESPDAFERIQQLVATGGPRNSRARQRERLAAMYAQRFCAKNDTNSICGPHGLGRATAAASEHANIAITGEDARRRTYFSHWAAERLLGEAVRRTGDDAAIVTRRLRPSARIEAGSVSWCVMDHDATTTFRRRYARAAMPPAGIALLEAMHRPRTLAELTALGPELGFDDDELREFLDELVANGVVLGGPTLPPGSFYPLRAVVSEVEGWPASEARTWALGEAAALEQLVSEFARASLDARLEIYPRLSARFVAATGEAASRGAGRHYADRSVLHEDCYVEVRSDLGPMRAVLEDALPALTAALELPLELARERVREWFRARFGAEQRIPALDAHRAFDEERPLQVQAGSPRADLLRAAIERVRTAIGAAVAAASDRPARLSSGDLRRALGDLPPSTRPGYLSADLMVRKQPDETTELVLGEVHGFFWLPTSLLDVLPPDERDRVVEDMRAAVRAMASGRRTAECVFLHTQMTDRRFTIASTDLQLMIPGDRADALDLGMLDLRLVGDEFEFLHGEEEIIPLVSYTQYPFMLYTSRIAPLLDDFAERFFPESLLPTALREGDSPRLAIDGLVFRRRLWRRSAAALRTALAHTNEAELFRRAQLLRRELGCDRCVFATFAGEPKPVLLDFENILLLEAIANLLEHQPDSAMVKLGEMLPGPGELVAQGSDGLRTAELRMGFYRT